MGFYGIVYYQPQPPLTSIVSAAVVLHDKIKVISAVNPELSKSSWSRFLYSLAFLVCSQEFKLTKFYLPRSFIFILPNPLSSTYIPGGVLQTQKLWSPQLRTQSY